MKYVIVDDEQAAIDVLEFHLKNVPFMELMAKFRSPVEALEYLQETKVDLLFLDINMPSLSGINLPKLLENPPLLIFTTAYSEYAIESYGLSAVDYLLKPIKYDRLLEAVMKAKVVLKNSSITSTRTEEITAISSQTVMIKSGTEFHQVPIKNIRYVESDGNYVTIHTTKRFILARYKISEVLELLPVQLFTRIHRSYIVALNHIETIKRHCVIIDGKEIPISGNYREGFLATIEKR